MGIIRRNARLYSLAALAAVCALLLRRILDPLLGNQNSYPTLWLAIVFSAWYCGVGPSVVAVAIGLLGIRFFGPYHSAHDHAEIFGMLIFVAFSVVIIALGEITRRRTAKLADTIAEAKEKAELLDLANDAIFVKTADGRISYWNRGAERLYGWTMSEALGHFPAELLRSEYPIPLSEIESSDDWEGEIRHTTRDGMQIVVASRWTTLRAKDGQPVAWLEINTDVTSRKRAEEAARRLSGRILTLQDEERRKIARALHDSLGQYLASLKMNLDRLLIEEGNKEKLATECFAIVDQCLSETRTISHLLHPPLLDEAGFGSAARWYIEGFAERSGIDVNINLPPNLDRLTRDIETALFRTLQESLTNVHRHSGASAVEVYVRLDSEYVYLEVSDNGRGIPKKRLNHLQHGEAGVGIAGMRERIRELRGSLEMLSDGRGTRVIVAIPLLQRTALDTPQANTGQSVSAA